MKADTKHPIFVLYDKVNKRFAQGPNFVEGTPFIDFATHYNSIEAAERIARRLLLKWEVTTPPFLTCKDMKAPIYEVRPVIYELGEVASEVIMHERITPTEEKYVIIVSGIFEGSKENGGIGFFKQKPRLNLWKPVLSIKEATTYSSLKRAQKALKCLADTEWQGVTTELAEDNTALVIKGPYSMTYSTKSVKDFFDEKLESTFKW